MSGDVWDMVEKRPWNSGPQMCKCVLWACPMQCTLIYNDTDLHLPHTRSTPCPSCGNQACLQTLTKAPSEDENQCCREQDGGTWLEKNFGANLNEDTVQHSKYKGKYSCHSGWPFWPVWRDPTWTRMLATIIITCPVNQGALTLYLWALLGNGNSLEVLDLPLLWNTMKFED